MRKLVQTVYYIDELKSLHMAFNNMLTKTNMPTLTMYQTSLDCLANTTQSMWMANHFNEPLIVSPQCEHGYNPVVIPTNTRWPANVEPSFGDGWDFEGYSISFEEDHQAKRITIERHQK